MSEEIQNPPEPAKKEKSPATQSPAAKKRVARANQAKSEQIEGLRKARIDAEKLLEVLDGPTFHQAGAGMAASHLFELLQQFKTARLKKLLDTNPEIYTRFVNTLSRLSDGQLKYENYKREVEEHKARLEQELANVKTQVGLTTQTLLSIERELRLF
jgi:hypothetical protein